MILCRCPVASNLPTVILGGSGNDFLQGGGQSNLILGGDGRDTLVGQQGRDILIGDAGRDLLLGSFGEDVLAGDDARIPWLNCNKSGTSGMDLAISLHA